MIGGGQGAVSGQGDEEESKRAERAARLANMRITKPPPESPLPTLSALRECGVINLI